MAIVRWDPLKDLMAIHERMNKVFDETFSQTANANYGEWLPPVDIYETDEEITILAELAGMKESDMDLEVTEGVLTLKGNKPYPIDKESDNYFRLERSYGKFSRSFAIPTTVDLNNIKANLKDGLLKVTLVKKSEVQPRVIKVETVEDK